jgi:hypothetical protein
MLAPSDAPEMLFRLVLSFTPGCVFCGNAFRSELRPDAGDGVFIIDLDMWRTLYVAPESGIPGILRRLSVLLLSLGGVCWARLAFG